jgi:hypothetical protein
VAHKFTQPLHLAPCRHLRQLTVEGCGLVGAVRLLHHHNVHSARKMGRDLCYRRHPAQQSTAAINHPTLQRAVVGSNTII